MKNIVWLASYPKSGNTWFRAFLANLLHENEDPADINRLGGGPIFSSRPVFDNGIGIQSSDMLADEIEQLRPAVYNEMSSNASQTLFIKAHDAYTYLQDGQPLFPTAATRGAIYLLRNPLDVAPSFANHSSTDIDSIIHTMNDPQHSFCGHSGNLANQLRQKLLGWSGHVKSWLDATEIDVHFVRYEDMKSRPLETFRDAIRFAGLEHTDEEILKALDACAFDKLQAQEKQEGFREKAARVKSFFRKGEVGSWQESLSLKHASSLIEQHAAIMKRFNYLAEDGSFTFAETYPESARTPLLEQLDAYCCQQCYRYKLYGLTVTLPFDFAELLPATDENTDVKVMLQSIDESQIDWKEQSICYKATNNYYLLEFKSIARFLIRDGREIIIEIEPGADLDAVRLMLLSPVFGILLLQRGLLPFWGSCVEYAGKAYALLGRSSTGKSFIAAGLRERGFKVLSDNLCVLDHHMPPGVLAGYPFLMMWQRGLAHLGAKTTSLRPVRQGLKKYVYPLGDMHQEQALELAGIYLLSSHNRDEFTIEPLSGAQSMFKLLDFTFHEPVLKTLGKLRQQYKIASNTAKTVFIKRYSYLDSNDSFKECIDLLEQDIKQFGSS